VQDVARCHGRSLQSLAQKLAQNPTDACDLLQDAFERALRSDGDLEPEELRRWLVTVLRHLAVDRARHRQWIRRALALYAASLPPSAEDDADEASPWSNLTSENVSMAVQKLDTPFREVFERHAVDTSLMQTAAELGIPASTAGTRLYRARRKLRALLASAP
jgi:RNA polymerase sigma-70 factor, ECF subfamily